MTIYARCIKCRRDNTVSLRNCKGCGAKLGTKYRNYSATDPRLPIF